MNVKILATLGPSSLNKKTVRMMDEYGIYLFRINLSHTTLDSLSGIITDIRSWTNVPICLDSEGAQVRNQNMIDENVYFKKNSIVKIHHETVIGDSNNISFTPKDVAQQVKVGDIIKVDFNSVRIRVIECNKDHSNAIVEHGGVVGSNKASDINRNINLNAVTDKDRLAFKMGMDMGVKHYSLSFTNSANDVIEVRDIIGKDSVLISKIESIEGVLNLDEIIPTVDYILIDRGDLSREVAIEKIPFIQRKIISHARYREKEVFVATNLLESMLESETPTRAEVNDIASTILMGANGLVLAAETAIGAYPVGSVKMVSSVIKHCENWAAEYTINDILLS